MSIIVLPTASDYREALQNPASTLRDPELRRGRPDLDGFEMPRAISGNSASVFSLRSGVQRYALKCFTRRVDGQAERYQMISAALARLRAPWLVRFEFLPEEILIGRVRHPALKMEWVDAVGMIAYVREHLNDTAVLRGLLEGFVALVWELETAGIAHGDLQHGNILVAADGQLRLVDYDGMYVPGLERLGAIEVGHRNYQSPRRTLADFGPKLDRFSAWVIYTSLAALTIDASLWHRLDAGDERLLFGRDDLDPTAASSALDVLELSGNPNLGRLSMFIRDIALRDLESVPPLTPETAMGMPEATVGTVQGVPAWVEHRYSEEQGGVQHAQGVSEPASWVLDRLPKPEPVIFTARPARTRLLLLGLLGMLTGGAGLALAGLAIPGAGLAFGWLAVTFLAQLQLLRATPEWRAKREHRIVLSSRTRAERAAARRVAQLEEARGRVDVDERKARERSVRRQQLIRRDYQSAVEAAERSVQRQRWKIARARQRSYDEELEELRKRLLHVQQAHIDATLAAHTVEHPSLRGLDHGLREALRYYGFRSALDIAGFSITMTGGRYPHRIVYLQHRGGVSVHVRGVGPQRARRLIEWRNQVARQAATTAPHLLPPAEENKIRDGFRRQRLAWDDDERRAHREAVDRSEEARQVLHARLTEIGRALREAQQGAAESRGRIDADLIVARKAANEAKWRRVMAERTVSAYQRITFWSLLHRAMRRDPRTTSVRRTIPGD
jgi:hypothetical protein